MIQYTPDNALIEVFTKVSLLKFKIYLVGYRSHFPLHYLCIHFVCMLS